MFVFKRKFFRARLIFWAAILTAAFIALTLSREMVHNRELAREIGALEDEAKRVAERNREMIGLVEKLNAADFLEHEAREKIGFQKSGETVVIVSGIKREERVDEGGSRIVDESNSKKWWRYFVARPIINSR